MCVSIGLPSDRSALRLILCDPQVNHDQMTNATPVPSQTTRLHYEADHRLAQVLIPVMGLLCFAGVMVVSSGVMAGWYLVILFGLATLALVMQVLPGSCFLEIDAEKLTICTQFKPRHYFWSDVRELGIKPVGVFQVVGLRLMPASLGKYGLRHPAPKGEWDILISNRYNLPSQELVHQLNLVRSSLAPQPELGKTIVINDDEDD